jgi:hypothetical protein
VKRRRAWKIVLAVASIIVLTVGGLVLDAHRRAAALLDREREVAKAEVAAYLKRDPSRPSASRDPIDGNAWDNYGPAILAVQAIPDELVELFPQLNGEFSEIEIPPDDHALHNLILQIRPEMERLRKGTRCRTVWFRQQTLDLTDDLPATGVIRTCKVLAGVVAHEHRMGRDDESLRAAALGLEFAQDYGRTELLISALVHFVGEGTILNELKEMFADGPVDPTLLTDFAGTLERLEASRPEFMNCWPGEQAFMKRVMIDAPWDGLFPRWMGLGAPAKPAHVWPGWRMLFSERIARAQAVVRLNDCFQQIEGLRPLTSWERVAAAEALDHSNHPSGPHGSNGNPLLDAVLPSIGRSFQRDAVARLQRTLLRLAVAVARYEADNGHLPAALQDLVPKYVREIPLCPMTGLPLHYKDGRIWSVGKNLVDDGGVEDPQGADDGGDHGDVVWTVRARK